MKDIKDMTLEEIDVEYKKTSNAIDTLEEYRRTLRIREDELMDAEYDIIYRVNTRKWKPTKLTLDIDGDKHETD